MQNNILYIFVIKSEPFGVKRSMRLIWNKKKLLNKTACFTAEKMRFSIKDFFSKCDQI